MRELYEKINKILTSDAELRGLLGYIQQSEVPIGLEGVAPRESSMNIRRGYNTDGKWERLMVFYFQPDSPIADFSPNIRGLPLIIQAFDRVSDLSVYDLVERAVELLDDADLSVESVFSYGCTYDGQIGGVVYDKEIKSFSLSARFVINARKEK